MTCESNSKYTTFKLTYFPYKALAEPIRFILSYGQMEFEDIRIPHDEWPKIRQIMPFGQVPVLEYDGKLAYQSVAIARYLAKQTDLMGNDDWQNLQIDSMVDTITDLRMKISNYNVETNVVQKETLRKKLDYETLPYYLPRLNAIVSQNNGYLALDKLTWADIYFVSLLDYCNGVMQRDIIKDLSSLCELRDTVQSIPAIKEWIEKRPESDY